MSGYESIAEVLKAARDRLAIVELAMEDFRKGATEPRREAGLLNVVVWGRSVTFVLQNIRTFDRAHFNEWYAPKKEAMRANARFEYLKELRNQLEKQGQLGPLAGRMYIEHLNTSDINKLQPPPNASGFFIGDSLGGSGWTVAMPTGTTQKFYIELPPSMEVTTASHFMGAAGKGEAAPPEESVDAVLGEYLAYLSGLVSEAESEFGHR